MLFTIKIRAKGFLVQVKGGVRKLLGTISACAPIRAMIVCSLIAAGVILPDEFILSPTRYLLHTGGWIVQGRTTGRDTSWRSFLKDAHAEDECVIKKNRAIHWDQHALDVCPPLQFRLLSTPQDAVFEISIGWTGGMGEAVLEPCFTSIKYFNDYPIFFDVTTIEHVLVENMPSSWSGEARIRIFANITLAMREAPNYSIPDAPKESFFEATLNTLYDTCILFEVGEISPIQDLNDLKASLKSLSSLIDAGFDAEKIDYLKRLIREMEGLDQRVLDYPVVIDGKNAILSVRLAMDHRQTRTIRFFTTAPFHKKLKQVMHRQPE